MNVIVITDCAANAELEFKILRQKLSENGFLSKSDSRYWLLEALNITVVFWNANGSTCIPVRTSNITYYSNCNIGMNKNQMSIHSQIEMWERIEQLMCNFPPEAKEIPYKRIGSLEIFTPTQSP